MRPILQRVIDTIPDYQAFLTPDELDESSRALAAEFPETVRLSQIGRTREGRPLLCLEIGDADAPERPAALVLGVPHPNEPIGTMLCEHFTRCLAQSRELRDELGYTWHFVKAWDADSLAMNTWLKGPFTVTNYSRNFYRPAGYEQVEWTFSVDYKTLHFHEPLPETQAVADLIDRVHPMFQYSLHNSGFGGVYWYQTDKTPAVWAEMRDIVAAQGLPLHLGEAEAPYAVEWAPALYRLLTVEDDYDYQKRYGAGDPADKISGGTSGMDYARSRYGTVGFVNEMPYFFDPRIQDTSPTSRTRRDVVLESIHDRRMADAFIRGSLDASRPYMNPANHFLRALDAFTKFGQHDAAETMAKSDPAYDKPATVAEEFDNLLVRPFYTALSLGMLIRANESELKAMEERGESDLTKRLQLEVGRDRATERHAEQCEMLERELHYTVIPIKKLVSIQLACGMLVADQVRRGGVER